MTPRRYWLADRCPCCGSDYWGEHYDGTEPRWVAEGVRLCGWCVAREHDAGDVLPLLLQAIVTGEDV